MRSVAFRYVNPVVVLITLLTAACTCSTPCPPGQKRDTLCNCYVEKKDGQIINLPGVFVCKGDDLVNNGGCPARDVFLCSIESRQATVVVEEKVSRTDGTRPRQQTTYTVEGNTSVGKGPFLGRTSAHEDGGFSPCVDVDYAIKSSKVSTWDPPPQRAQPVLYFASMAVEVAPAEACEKECDDDTPLCASTTMSGPEAASLLELKKRMRVSDVITSRELRELFQLADDPCKRGDTSLRDGMILNSGEPCVLKGRLEKSAATYDAELSVPATLRANWSLQGEMLAASFEDPARGPILRFMDAELDANWGGNVSSLTVRSGTATITVSNGCLRARLSR